jgi:hypothetical protein
MTKKRYHKLMYAALSRLMHDDEKNHMTGECLKAGRNDRPRFGAHEGLNSYQDAWNMMLPLRKCVGMENITK